MAYKPLPSNLQVSPYNSALSSAVPQALGREYAVFAWGNMTTKEYPPDRWTNADIFSLQFQMRPARQKTDGTYG